MRIATVIAFGLLFALPAFAAGGGVYSYAADPHPGDTWMSVIYHAINLALFLAIVLYFGRRAIGDTLGNRALAIKNDLAASARLRDEARQRSQDLEERLGRIEAEIAGMRATATAEAENEEARLIERAHTEAARIAETAERTIRDEVTRARFALKRDAVALAVDLAEVSLRARVDDAQQQRLAKEFLQSISNNGENRV